ncbi:MAG: ribonucleoside-diphosphate reductase beta chain [Actinomycetota bacterium]|jgi:ribonucleoside-diphosphate reductase beta chain|nr:ribonucleoside-diphosphate reductase beta chain [Actinomycetota bacterium]
MSATGAVDTSPSPATDYRALYYRWEQEHWSASAIDLTEDRRQWVDMLTDEDRRVLAESVGLFYSFSEVAASSLVRFVDAAPTEEQHVFLTTQLVDHARHVVFFDRVQREVIEVGDPTGDRFSNLNDGSRSLLYEMLPDVSERLRGDTDGIDDFVAGIVLFHIVIEGTVILTLQKFLLGHLSSHAALPGFSEGCGAVARDGARHVEFAAGFLRDAVARDADIGAVIAEAVDHALPAAGAAFDGPRGDETYFNGLPYGPTESRTWALEQLRKRLRSIGVHLPD